MHPDSCIVPVAIPMRVNRVYGLHAFGGQVEEGGIT